jgi:hypothetical protein
MQHTSNTNMCAYDCGNGVLLSKQRRGCWRPTLSSVPQSSLVTYLWNDFHCVAVVAGAVVAGARRVLSLFQVYVIRGAMRNILG